MDPTGNIIRSVQASGPIGVGESEPPKMTGTEEGFFGCMAAIAVKGLSGDNLRDVAIKLTSNTTQEHALTPGHTYTATFRLVKPNASDEYKGFYHPQLALRLPLTTNINHDLGNKVTIYGLGIVITRTESTHGRPPIPKLTVSVRHQDYDDETDQHTDFDVTYIVLNRGDLTNSFGLFQPGREMFLTGIIIDWDEEKSTWVVLTTNISPTSGHLRPVELNNELQGL